MNLKLRNLQIFRAVLDAGSVSRAAQALNLTQPAVSLALSSLEEDLGFALFHRARGFFAPTAEALLLAEDAEQCLLTVERIEGRAKAIAQGKLGSISIASNGAAAINLLPDIITTFRRDHPEVTVDLKIRSSRQIAAWAAGNQIDLGLIDAPVPVTNVESEIFRFPCVCVLGADDPLAQHDTIRPEHLSGRSVIAITGDHPVDRQVDALCAAVGVAIERSVVCGYFAIARKLAGGGSDIALVDAMNGAPDPVGRTIVRPFKPAVWFELALIRPKAQAQSQPLAEFYDLLTKRLRELLPAGRQKRS